MFFFAKLFPGLLQEQKCSATRSDSCSLVSAPVADIPSYLNWPGTTIQPGDFTELEKLINVLHNPDDISGLIINSVFANKKGDAINTSAITGSGATFPISATVVGFNGKGLIVGGAGKFANAVSEFDYHGYFNLLDQNDAEYNAEGWIDL